MTTVVTYLFDPLCGWCYGAAPMLGRLAATPGLAIRPAPTGLFAGAGARPMDAQFAAYAWANDQRIKSLTGQPFSADYRRNVLEGQGRRFDSGPATLALTAVHVTSPDLELAALEAIQHARYVQGRDNTDVAVLAEILDGLHLANAARRIVAPDDDLLSACRSRISAARTDMRSFGVEGVPAVLVGDGATRRLLGGNLLFGRPEELLGQLIPR